MDSEIFGNDLSSGNVVDDDECDSKIPQREAQNIIQLNNSFGLASNHPSSLDIAETDRLSTSLRLSDMVIGDDQQLGVDLNCEINTLIECKQEITAVENITGMKSSLSSNSLDDRDIDKYKMQTTRRIENFGETLVQNINKNDPIFMQTLKNSEKIELLSHNFKNEQYQLSNQPLMKKFTKNEASSLNTVNQQDNLPLFANERSKLLAQEIKKQELKLDELSVKCKEHKERVRIMEEHSKNVQQEIANTNFLLQAKQKEIETERSIRALSERESGRYYQEIKRMDNEISEFRDKLKHIQDNIFSSTEKLEKFKLNVDLKQEELEQWVLSARQKEEDNVALQRYKSDDEIRARELIFQIEKLSKLTVEKQSIIENLNSTETGTQVELDRTAEAYKALHKERQNLIKQWQEVVLMMRKRDEEIQILAGKYEFAHQNRLQKEILAKQSEQRYQLQIEENQEMNAVIEKLERHMAQRKQDQVDATARLSEFEDELGVIRSAVSAGALALSRKRALIGSLSNQLEDQKLDLGKAREKYTAAKMKMELESKKRETGDQAVKKAELELQENEVELKKVTRGIARIQESLYKESTALHSMKQKEFELAHSISGARAVFKNLTAKISALDERKSQQEELIYTADFQILQMERKVLRGLGERSNEENSLLLARIKKLESASIEEQNQRRMLIGQARKVKNELRAALRRYEKVADDKELLLETLCELELSCNGEESALKSAKILKENAMVEVDLLKLDLKKLRHILNNRVDQVYSLETSKNELELTMKQQKLDITAHMEVQRAALRLAEDERHRIQLELNKRQQAVKILQRKFEILMGGSDRPDDQLNVTEHGQNRVQILIAVVQKREELQREGDTLDLDITAKEKEIRALECTLQHLNNRNTDYRMSFHKADPESSDANLLRQLEQQGKVTQDELFELKKELQRLETDIDQDKFRHETLTNKIASFQSQNLNLTLAAEQIENDLKLTLEDSKKIQFKLKKLQKHHREIQNSNSETISEVCFRSEALKDCIAVVLYALGQLAREFPEMHDVLYSSLRNRGLVIPKRPPLGVFLETRGEVRSDISSSRGSEYSYNSSRKSVNSGASASVKNIEFQL